MTLHENFQVDSRRVSVSSFERIIWAAIFSTFELWFFFFFVLPRLGIDNKTRWDRLGYIFQFIALLMVLPDILGIKKAKVWDKQRQKLSTSLKSLYLAGFEVFVDQDPSLFRARGKLFGILHHWIKGLLIIFSITIWIYFLITHNFPYSFPFFQLAGIFASIWFILTLICMLLSSLRKHPREQIIRTIGFLDGLLYALIYLPELITKSAARDAVVSIYNSNSYSLEQFLGLTLLPFLAGGTIIQFVATFL
jgi:hypothetical protein